MSSKSYNNKTMSKATVAPPKRFEFTPKTFGQRELLFWFRYGITEEVLHRFHVKALTCFKSINREGELPLDGGKAQKDISDFFSMGQIAKDLKELLAKELNKLYANTLMMMKSCEIDYDNPPEASHPIVSVNGVPLGTQDNLFCITGGEGTGKSNYISAILSGAINEEALDPETTLWLRIAANPRQLAVLHYDTEQSEA